MAYPIFLTFATSQTVTSAFQLDAALPHAVWVPSWGTAARVFVQFATLSGTAPFATLQQYTGTGQDWTVFSGAGTPAVGIFERCPSPWGRLALSSCQVAVMSVAICPAR